MFIYKNDGQNVVTFIKTNFRNFKYYIFLNSVFCTYDVNICITYSIPTFTRPGL